MSGKSAVLWFVLSVHKAQGSVQNNYVHGYPLQSWRANVINSSHRTASLAAGSLLGVTSNTHCVQMLLCGIQLSVLHLKLVLVWNEPDIILTTQSQSLDGLIS